MKKFTNYIKNSKVLIKIVIWLSVVIFIVDNIYKIINNISYVNREKCFFFKNSSKGIFLIYENFIELWIVMIVGVLLAVLLSRYFSKYKKVYPKGPIRAFIYGSIIPVCSCSALPLIVTLKDRLKFRTVITFAVAAPLLSPTIIMISLNVLGIKYTILRIICSFILAVGAGYFLEIFYKPEKDVLTNKMFSCDKNCHMVKKNIYEETWEIAKKLFPYVFIAGIITSIFSIFEQNLINHFSDFASSWYGKILSVFIGIPMYVCNGADIFILRSFFGEHNPLQYGTALAFSLSASAVCISSIVMLYKIIGKKLTILLVGYITVVCLVIALIL